LGSLTKIFAVLIFASLYSCAGQPENVNDEIEVFKTFKELESMIEKYNREDVVIVNFWATTCPPCLKEMPHFIQLQNELYGRSVKVILVSLDKEEELFRKVKPFVVKLKITPEVVLLADENYSDWTDKVDPSWYGALPATLIMNGDQRKFRFGAYESYSELLGDVEILMK